MRGGGATTVFVLCLHTLTHVVWLSLAGLSLPRLSAAATTQITLQRQRTEDEGIVEGEYCTGTGPPS